MTNSRDLANLGGGFIQAGGGVQRSVESKLQDVVSVKDFGAVGDGVTDDTAAIQAAINKATEYVNAAVSTSYGRGATVYFPKGIYKVTAQISLSNSSYVLLDGDGPLCSTITTTINGTFMKGVSINDFGIHNLSIINTGTPTTGYAVELGGDPLANSVPAFARYLDFSNLHVSGFANGVKINGALATTLNDVRIGGNSTAGSFGLYLGDAVVTTATGNGSTTVYALAQDNTNFPVIVYVEGQQVSNFTKTASNITFSTAPANGAKIRIHERLVQGTTVSGDNVYISNFATGFKNFVEGASFNNLIIEGSSSYAIENEASFKAHLYLEGNTKAIKAWRPFEVTTNQSDNALWGVIEPQNNFATWNKSTSGPTLLKLVNHKLTTNQTLTGSLAAPGRLSWTPVIGEADVDPTYIAAPVPSGGGIVKVSGVVNFTTSLTAGQRIRLRVEYNSYVSPGVYSLYWFEIFEIGGSTNPAIHYPSIQFSSTRFVSLGTRISISAYSDNVSEAATGTTTSGYVSYVNVERIG